MIDFTTAFYCLATALVTSASLVAFSNHPVRAVMSLILTFVLTAALWILLSAEFRLIAHIRLRRSCYDIILVCCHDAQPQ